MLDLNGFKQVNDTYGHAEGDEALRIVGKLLLGTVPRGCVAARYAGDEFFSVMDKEMYREKHSFYVQAGHNRRASDRR